MSKGLQLNSQKWTLSGSNGLKLFLPRQRHERCIYFQMDWSFIPAEGAAPVPADAPKLRLRLIGFVPGLRDWRDLENVYLGYKEPVAGEKLPDTRGPDMWIWPPGETKPLHYGRWETNLKFGERKGLEFEFSLDASILSERAAKFRSECHMKEFFQQPLPADWELPEWINEVDEEMSFAGRIEFREIFCSVPINSAQPIEWARKSALRELAVEQSGAATLADPDHAADNYKPNDGISETGRLVVLAMLAD